MTTPATKPGRPRNPEVAAKVRVATIKLLSENGYAALRVDDVARVSGVAKTTLYRRWPTLPALVLDALEGSLNFKAPSSTGNPDVDVVTFAGAVHKAFVVDPVGRLVPGVAADLAGHPDLAREFAARIVAPVEEALADIEDADGASSANAALAADAMLGLVFLRVMIGAADPTPDDLAAVARGALGDGRRAQVSARDIAQGTLAGAAKAATAAGAALDTARKSLFRRGRG
ncbi:MAG: TetR/AcrR family transcriptional regulator [Propionibacteriaceae bacterium]|nr:TetR/AcrR family transcriptional regulator [Micropruina sp.]HBX81052.1 hypothetical protein [Propionibacteriaceae bacterium]HBY22632.1 hypothetical protein [Propionibacteriaceae bacterium]